MVARKHWLVVLVLLTGACTAEPPSPAPSSRTPWKPPSLVNEEARYQGVLHFVRDVIDGRTVELADGTKARIAQLAEPPACWSEGALSFARTTLLATAVRISPVVSGDVNLTLEDGTDYALLAVRQGVLRAQGVDGGALLTAESEAAGANKGLWGPPCDGLDAPLPPATTGLPAPDTTAAPPRPVPTTTVPPRPAPTTTVPPKPPARTCAVAYRISGQWPGGFQANVNVRNTGSTSVNGWTLRWSFANGQTVTEMWNAKARQSGATVNAANADYNPQIQPGGSVSIGFNGSVRGSNSVPGAFTLNGQSCSVE
ncbi:cellulose-binding domain-containing protein [Lentzea flaviverrucosa]|uniref:Cellulose binding domain-containing protein n=1 Tax=Lentzea flaviverrucosa TaxID=200379 RepID=A0A1H9J053_9PSEU|nr:cellulose-binding domain-containing protein [Lentzea flaviverrucosa]RDI16820.1 cellulose binding domain-containing protein [Lentzea flaviverrucosa]SEQ80149.1 Cellulose binding domain-containing protein [Lentzea flaviverrucosa]